MCSCTEFTLQGAVCEASYIVHTLIGNATPHCIHHRLCNLPTESLNVSSSSTSSPSFFTSGVIFTLWALHGASGQSCATLDSSNVPQNTDLPKVRTKSMSMTPSWVIKTQNFQAVVCTPWIYQFLGCSQQFGIYSGSLQMPGGPPFHTRKTYKNQKPNKSPSNPLHHNKILPFLAWSGSFQETDPVRHSAQHQSQRCGIIFRRHEGNDWNDPSICYDFCRA